MLEVFQRSVLLLYDSPGQVDVTILNVPRPLLGRTEIGTPQQEKHKEGQEIEDRTSVIAQGSRLTTMLCTNSSFLWIKLYYTR